MIKIEVEMGFEGHTGSLWEKLARLSLPLVSNLSGTGAHSLDIIINIRHPDVKWEHQIITDFPDAGTLFAKHQIPTQAVYIGLRPWGRACDDFPMGEAKDQICELLYPWYNHGLLTVEHLSYKSDKRN